MSKQSDYYIEEAQISLNDALKNFQEGNFQMEITYLKQAKELVEDALKKAYGEQKQQELYY